MTNIDKSALNIPSFTLKPGAAVIERARSYLNERLQPLGLECESVYLNTVNNIVDARLTFSQDLLGLALDTLEWGTVQSHDEWESGVFSEPWTFEDSHRLVEISIKDIGQLMTELLDDAHYSWMIQAG